MGMEQPGDLLGEVVHDPDRDKLEALRRVQRASLAGNVPLPASGGERHGADATGQFMNPFDNPQAPRSSLFGKE